MTALEGEGTLGERSRLWPDFERELRAVSDYRGPIDLDKELSTLDIDSLGITSLVFALEDLFDFEFTDEMLTMEVFETVGSLWRAVVKTVG